MAPQRYLSGVQPLTYSIYFDNQPTASAPAQTVSVTDVLNTNGVDLNTLTLGAISFVDKLVTPPSVPLASLGTFSADVDLRPGTNLIVRISASLNTATGVLKWTFTSIDPATGQPTTDPLAEFLPPGQEGSVSFTVAPKAATTGTQITNKATIVFDANQPIDTPVWLNTIDNTAPTSKVSPLAGTQTSLNFTVQWSGSDVGSGIQDFTVYASDNGAAFTPWLINTTGTSATYTGQNGHTYRFYSIGRDLVGNIEGAKSPAEATTMLFIEPATLTITQAHIDPFKQGDLGDAYIIAVQNSGGSTVGNVVTVRDSLPAGLTATAITGTGWSCTNIPPSGIAGPAILTCTRTDTLDANSGYPPIILTVSVDSSAPQSVTNTATVSLGSDSNPLNSSTDLTNIVPSIDLLLFYFFFMA